MKEKNIKVIWPNNEETFVSDGDDWFSSAEKAGLEIPTDASQEVVEPVKLM